MKLNDAGHRTALLTLTRGGVGGWSGREMGSWTHAELADEREGEWGCAVERIGYHSARLLDWPDGGLALADAEAVTAEIVSFMRETRPDVVCTFGPDGGGSEHNDHRATSFLAARGFARAGEAELYPDRGSAHAPSRLFFTAAPPATTRPGTAPLTPTHAVDVSAYETRVEEAFECHRTQAEGRTWFSDLRRTRGGVEYFHLAIERAAPTRPEDDLLA